MIIQALKATPDLQGVLIGSNALFRDPGAMMMEIGDPSAAEEAYGLTKGMVMVSRRLALMTTGKNLKEWIGLANLQAERDPLACIERVRYRSGWNGGKDWMKPTNLEAMLKGMKAVAATKNLPDEVARRRKLKLEINVQGIVCGDPNALAQMIMLKIQEKTGCTLVQQLGQGEMGDMQWQAGTDFLRFWNGRVWIQAATEQIGDLIFKNIHGTGLEVNGRCYAIEVNTFGNRQDASRVTSIQHSTSSSSGGYGPSPAAQQDAAGR